MKLKFPLAIPEGEKLYITQGYKSSEMADFYKENGISWSTHPAIDVARESQVKTFGTPFVCPFTYGTLDRVNPPKMEDRSGGYIQIRAKLANGDDIRLACAHLSGVEPKEVYAEGDIMGYLGNYSLVSPAPTIGRPFDGAHAHIETMVNGSFVNPLDYFDIHNPYRSKDTGNDRDVLAIQWAFQEIKKYLKKLGL